MEIIIHADLFVREDSPVLILLPGGGKAITSLTSCFGKAPVPAWYIACAAGNRGNIGKRAPAFTRRLPQVVIHLLELLQAWVGDGVAASATSARRKRFLLGFSRGASWGVKILHDHARLIDGAVLLAPYPETKDQWSNEQDARNVMRAPVPTMLIHFVDDVHCNAVTYPAWFNVLAQGMAVPPTDVHGGRSMSFYSTCLTGDHDRASYMLSELNFDDVEDWRVRQFWRALMRAPCLRNRRVV